MQKASLLTHSQSLIPDINSEPWLMVLILDQLFVQVLRKMPRKAVLPYVTRGVPLMV